MPVAGRQVPICSCGVPNNIHGTACGFENANKPIEEPTKEEKIFGNAIYTGLYPDVKEIISKEDVVRFWHWSTTHEKECYSNIQKSVDNFFQKKQPAPSVKEETVSNDWEKEAEELYLLHSCQPESEYINDERRAERKSHMKACQMHRNDGLTELIEWLNDIMPASKTSAKNSRAIIETVIERANEIKSK